MSSTVLDPPKTNLDPLVQKVLEWMNEQRAVRGLEPLEDLPRGYRRSMVYCPVAQGLGGNEHVSSTLYYTYDGNPPNFKTLPAYVQEFIGLFDKCEYQEYVADKE